jgi:hypothetical protein
MTAPGITATAAALGSLVGATASVVTTWITQRTQAVRAQREVYHRERETLYGEFVMEASRLTVEALSHSLEQPEALAKLYGILARIRLSAAGIGTRALLRVPGKGRKLTLRVRDR